MQCALFSSCSGHATSGRVFIHCIIFILSANVYYYYTLCLADAAAVLPDFKVEQCIDTQGPVPLPRTSESRLGFQFLGVGIRRWGLKVSLLTAAVGV